MSNNEVALMEQLHDEHADALWRFCLRLVGNDRARAEDVTQETMLRAWRHRAVLEGSSPALRAWLFTVARNIVVDEWRSPRRPPSPTSRSATRATTAATSCCCPGWWPRH
jgi:RNA polymerase sigma-70 factor (ECF subfamily)